MKTIFAYAWMLIFASIFIEGCFCKTTKRITKAIGTRDTLQTQVVNSNTNIDSIVVIKKHLELLNANNITYKTLKTKAKVEYANSKEGFPVFNAFIQIKHNEKIWVSIRGALDIEGIRALITPDSVIIIDYTEKVVYKRSFAYLQEITSVPFDFKVVENVLAGNNLYNIDTIQAYRYQNKLLSVASINQSFKNLLTIDTTDHTMVSTKLDDLDLIRNRTCMISYGNYEKIDNRLISMFRNIIISEKNVAEIKLTFKDFDFDREDLKFNFTIPKKFKIK
jgi:hypothetical protein